MTNSPRNLKAFVLCDFDGTIVNQDVFDEILYAFGEQPYGAIGTAFDDGRISHRQMNEGFADTLQCTPVELGAFLNEAISMREGFSDFYASLAVNNIGFVLISGGWDIYIRHVLKDYDLRFTNDFSGIADDLLYGNRIVIACNNLQHNGKSYYYNSHAMETERAAPDKALVAEQLRAAFQVPVICIGDGASDYEMAAASDFVFATGQLTNYCENNNISYLPFTNFHEINLSFMDILAKLEVRKNAKPGKLLANHYKCD